MQASKTYRFRFTVRGAGSFPFDMLRYDHCYPATSADAALLEHHEHDLRHVVLWADSPDRHWRPETGRWKSFCWEVINGAVEMIG